MSVMRLALAASAALLLAAPAVASADPRSGYYVEATGGVSFSGDLEAGASEFEMDTGYNFGGAIGAYFGQSAAVEFDVFNSHLGYAGFDASIDGLGMMLNVLYGFNPNGFADPYVGAGTGMVRVHFEEGGDSGSAWKFGYQLMGGVMLNLSETFGFFGEYRFQDAVGDADILGTEFEFQSHNVSGGVRASF